MAVRDPVRVAMVTNIPAPYRLPVYEILAKDPGLDFCAFFCSGREPDREWDLQQTGVKQVYFKEKFITYKSRFIHVNPDAWACLSRFKPDVVVTTGFNPTFLVAYAYAKLHRIKHVAMTDGTLYTESFLLSAIHRWVRRWVYSGTSAFIGASEGSFKLYDDYGVPRRLMFQSHLCANNEAFFVTSLAERPFDFVFSARFVAGKNPVFAMEVAEAVAKRLGRRTRLLMLGSGDLAEALESKARAISEWVDVEFAGFVKQGDLPARYASAKVLLFPTQIDTWGVVANEACAAGVPVLVTPMAGVSDDLVVDGVNGRVLPLELDRWRDAACDLLQDEAQWQAWSDASVLAVKKFSYANAADGIADAARFVLGQRGAA